MTIKKLPAALRLSVTPNPLFVSDLGVTVTEVEDNSFVGTVISAQTEDGNIFFGKAADFKTVA